MLLSREGMVAASLGFGADGGVADRIGSLSARGGSGRSTACLGVPLRVHWDVVERWRIIVRDLVEDGLHQELGLLDSRLARSRPAGRPPLTSG